VISLEFKHKGTLIALISLYDCEFVVDQEFDSQFLICGGKCVFETLVVD
jgi:hypothetical protein